MVGGRVGRFGWKCQHFSVLQFAADAYANEMGVSSDLAAFEAQPNGPPRLLSPQQCEDQPDPATGRRDVDNLADFMRFLAPPARTQVGPRGEQVFRLVGCADCHHASYPTVSDVAALNGKTIFAWSDFLLHDVGTGDGIEQDGAPANKLRTAPLLGLSHQTAFLHDASAETPEAAILAHAGEADGVRRAYQALPAADRDALLAFLRSL